MDLDHDHTPFFREHLLKAAVILVSLRKRTSILPSEG
jgi:hypothetical protein